ncbi:MAG: putative quinol monooxygenase [Acidimicrobiales bacterium]
MAKIGIIAKLTAKPGMRDQIVAAAGDFFPHVENNEPGTEIYILHEDRNDPNVAYYYELYADGDSLKAHGGSDQMKDFGRAIKDLLDAKMEVIMLNPLKAKGASI